jgi:hypothetical protein
MKADRLTKVVLWMAAILLFLNLAHSFLSSKPALATTGNEEIGRYMIAAWGSQGAQATASHTGYYILDTVTGKVVASHAEEFRPGSP